MKTRSQDCKNRNVNRNRTKSLSSRFYPLSVSCKIHVIQVPPRIEKSLEQGNPLGIRADGDRILYPRLGQPSISLDMNSCGKRLPRGYLRMIDHQPPSVFDHGLQVGPIENLGFVFEFAVTMSGGSSCHIISSMARALVWIQPNQGVGQQRRPFRLGRCCRWH